jgi:hypothetical protein
LGVTGRPLVKRPLSGFILKEDEGIYYRYRKDLQTGQPGACELRMVKDGGPVFWARLEAANPRAKTARLSSVS